MGHAPAQLDRQPPGVRLSISVLVMISRKRRLVKVAIHCAVRRAADRHGHGRTAAFAETHAEIEQRSGPGPQAWRWPVRGGMRVEEPFVTARGNPRGDQRRRGGNETVDEHRQPHLGAGEITADQCRDFESPETAQDLHGIPGMIAVQGECCTDYRCLPVNALRVEAGAGTGQQFRANAEQRTGDGCR